MASFPRYLATDDSSILTPFRRLRHRIRSLTMSDITTTFVYAPFTSLKLFAKLQHIHCPMNLPPELLIEIFDYCVSTEPLVLLTLRQVCSLWWKLIETSPRLWQSIVLDDVDVKFSERQAQLWTERSKPLKYDVELNIENPDYILPLLSPVLSSIDRWRRFVLSGKRNEEIVMGEFDITPESLTHLHLHLHDFDQDDFDEEEPKIVFSPISPAQNVNFSLNIWVSTVPPPVILPPLRFVHVTIAEGGSVGPHTQPKFILEFLTACPELESFYFSGYPHDGHVDGPIPLVNLPHLVTLHLKSTCFARTILSSLNTPRLEILYLSHLNVDFELYGQYNEEGDSEDQAHDYSQSPSSDRATGMGLRTLIKRCNPPLRVLEMDFCDMRTKDFIWVFDRLPLLEDFYIVASDMSNKVLSLLRPLPTSLIDGVGLRLPKLRRLRLFNCQRLSGKAIVHTLSQRVRWTDEEDPENTLMDVTIWGCDGFSQSDHDALSTVLQNRLK